MPDRCAIARGPGVPANRTSFVGLKGVGARNKGLGGIGSGLCWCALLSAPLAAHATTCTTQGEMNAQDRDTLASAGQQLGNAVIQQDFNSLQGTLLPAVAQQWEGIRGVIEQGAPYAKGGQVQLNALYLLDATSLTAAADAQFFCSNSNGSLTVTVSMRSLPPGKYAVILAYILGSFDSGPASQCDGGPTGVHPGAGRQRVEAGRRVPAPRDAGRARRRVVVGAGPRTGQAKRAVERLFLLRDGALPASAGGFHFVAQHGQAGPGAGADQGFARRGLSLLAARRSAHLEDRFGAL